MDLESLETQTLLKKRTPMRQSLALKLAVLLCGLGLFVGVAVPSTNRGDLQGKATLKEKEVTAAAGVSSTSRPASTMSMDWRAAAVAAPAWSTEAPAEDDSHDDTSRTPFGVACRGGGFRHTPRTSSRPSSRLTTRTGSSRTSTGRSQRRKPPAPRRSSKLGSRGRSSLRRFPDSGLNT